MNHTNTTYLTNLEKIIEGSAYINILDKDQKEALTDGYYETDRDLNSINVENDIINTIYRLTHEEFKRDFDKEEATVLHDGEKEIMFIA